MESQFLNLSSEKLDQHVYRIMPEAFVFSLFRERQNVLCQVKNWKDKFENFQLQLGGILNGKPFSYAFRDAFSGQCWTRDAYSEAMWGIYANDPSKRFLRIRSTPRKLLSTLANAHPQMPHETCFIGKVIYKKVADLKAEALKGGSFKPSTRHFANTLLLKRYAFRHEREVRLLYFGDKEHYDQRGLYRYNFDPHEVITQIMADPNRYKSNWISDKEKIKEETGFSGSIKRSKIYDPPNWPAPKYSS